MKAAFLLCCLLASASCETATVKATLRFKGLGWSKAAFTAQKQKVVAAAVSKSVGWPAARTSVLSFTQVPQPNTCKKVTVTGLQRHLSGVYAYVRDVGGRPAYKLASGYYLYYYSAKEYWMVGSKLGSSLGELVVSDKSKTISGIKRSWYQSTKKGKWVKALALSVKCQVISVLDVQFQLKAAGCAASQLNALKKLHPQFNNVVEEQKTLVKLLGIRGLATQKVMEAKVLTHAKCDVKMSLSMPKVKALPGQVQAACKHDGHKLQVTLEHKGHDSFACKHQKNAAGVIKCSCNTWNSAKAMKKVQAIAQKKMQVAAP